MNESLLIYHYLKIISISLVFTQYLFSVTVSRSGCHIAFLFHLYLSLCNCDNFLGFPCFWWPWYFWRLVVQLLYRLSLLELVWCFLMYKLKLQILGRKSIEVKEHFIIMYYQHDLSLLMLLLFTLMKCLSDFSITGNLPPTPYTLEGINYD